jgi:citrate lyase subunit beta/citryl-CoA lyase
MRSKLFVPAIRPELFEKALHSGADAVCFDLEDAVAPNRKSEAREFLRTFLSQRNPTAAPLLLVRTNAIAFADFPQDIACALWPSLYAIALPKVESAEEVCAAAVCIAEFETSRSLPSQVGILPTIESPRGLRFAAEIALSSPRVIGLQLGFADLLEPLGIATDNVSVRNQIRLMLRLAAAEAGVDCYDSAYASFKDLAGYERELRAAHSLGFSGSSCIHPRQVSVANLAFTPTDEELAHARRVVEAAEQAAREGGAVTTLDGKMIDAPFILRAHQLLARKLP